MTRRASIGFDRRIDLGWLDAAAGYAASVPGEEVRDCVWTFLEGVISGDNANSARGKTVTVLNHIWGDVPQVAEALRGRAVSRVEAGTPSERLALHWAMMVGTYPVFTDVAAAAGRLMTLQGSFSLAHLTRRLVGSWGERSTLTRAAQRIIRSMIQWGVLSDTSTKGMYEAAPGVHRVGPDVAVLLLEALLLDAEQGSVSFDQLVGHPALFPFDVQLNAGHVRSASQFQVHRQGLDSDFIEIRGDA